MTGTRGDDSGPSGGSDSLPRPADSAPSAGSQRQEAAGGAAPDAKAPPVAPGDVLAGKYRVERVLGTGGMGVVVLATQLAVERKVAIKFLLAQAATNAEHVRRFAREARAAAKIRSEHVVQVLDVGTLENGAPYLVMEHLEGNDLAKLLKARGPLPVKEVVEYVLQACEALAEAHVAGIVHRDLKPSNLFVTRRADGSRSVKVVDFGISKLIAQPDAAADPEGTLTSAVSIVGSPLYMSPEQVKASRDVDPRADIWSIGALIHKLLTGKAAFAAPSGPEIFVKILNGPTPLLRQVRPDLPEGLEKVVTRCLEKEREQRFANVGELAAALAPFGPERASISVERTRRVLSSAHLPGQDHDLGDETHTETGAKGQPDALEPGSAATSATNAKAVWGRSMSPGPRRRSLLAGMALLTLAAGAGFYVLRASLSPPVPARSAASPATTAAPNAPTDPAAVPPQAPATGETAVAPATASPEHSPISSAASAGVAPGASGKLPDKPRTAPGKAPRRPQYDDSEYGGRK